MNAIKPHDKSQENAQLIEVFWSGHPSAFFNQKVVAAVRNVSISTLENERWRGIGMPFRKVKGRVLYQKSDVINFLESYALVTSTSQYNQEVRND